MTIGGSQKLRSEEWLKPKRLKIEAKSYKGMEAQ